MARLQRLRAGIPVATRAGKRCLPPHSRSRSQHQSASRAGADTSELLTSFTVFNIQGLKPRTVPTKVPFLQDLPQHSNQLFVALTETWLREHLDAELQVEGYTLFRQNRHRPKRRRRGRDSGGVALYLRDDLASTAEPIFNFSNGVVEALGVHVKAENLVLIMLYRQPDDLIGRHRSTSAEFRQTLRELRSALNSLPSPTPDVIMCGSFNLPHVSWPGGTPCTGASREEKTMAQDLSELMEEHFLFQQIQKSTHRRGNVLDLCFCNNPEFLHSYQCTETALSDHHIIECHSTYSKRPAQQTSVRQPHTSDGPAATFDQLNFMSEEVDWDGLDRELQDIDWETEFHALSPSQMLSKLIDTCSCISQKYVP